MFCQSEARFWLSCIAALLYLFDAHNGKFELTEETVTAFNTLKEILSKIRVQTLPNMNERFYVFTAASKQDVRTPLVQKDDDGKVKIAQSENQGLTKVERCYRTFKKEAVAKLFALKNLRHYLFLAVFVVRIDHNGVSAAFEKADIHGWLAWWLDFMAEYEFQIKDVEGSSNVIADYSSRCEEDLRGTEDGRKLSIEMFFNEQTQKEEDLLEPTAVVTGEEDIDWFPQHIEIHTKTRNNVRVPVRLRREAKAYTIFQKKLTKISKSGPKYVRSL